MKEVKYDENAPELKGEDQDGNVISFPFCRNSDTTMLIFDSQIEFDEWLEKNFGGNEDDMPENNLK